MVKLDVTDDGSIRRAAEHLSKDFSHLDVLVNNAGIYPDEGVNILTVSRELLNLTMNTNAFSPIPARSAGDLRGVCNWLSSCQLLEL